MKCLEWLTEERLPSPFELEEMADTIMGSFFMLLAIGKMPAKRLFFTMLRIAFLIEAFEYGAREVHELVEQARKERGRLIYAQEPHSGISEYIII